MNHRPSHESSAQSLAKPGLNPVLQSALNCLDVQLEDELSRYRRQQAGRPTPQTRGLGRTPNRKPLDLIAVGATGGRTQPSTPETAPSRQPTVEAVVSPPYPATSTDSNPMHSATMGTEPTMAARLSAPASEPASPGFPTSLAIAPREPQVDANPQYRGTIDESSSLTIPVAPATAGGLLLDPHSGEAGPDDYLESSEQLLRSLAEEEAAARAERGFIDSLLTPMGVGSMLLLLLSSASLGYVIMNPSSLRFLTAGRQSQPTLATTQNSSEVLPPGSSAGIPNSPNLASQEFVDLNLSTLSTLANQPGANDPSKKVVVASPKPTTPNAAASPNPASNAGKPGILSTLTEALPSTSGAAPSITVPQPVAPPVSSAPQPAPARVDPPAPARSYEPPVVTQPAPVAAAPARTYNPPVVEPAAPAPEAATPTEANEEYYYVVTDYSSDRTLEQAREVVPDAYVRNFPEGAQVQLGAFNDPERAKALVDDLKSQGIEAQMYQR